MKLRAGCSSNSIASGASSESRQTTGFVAKQKCRRARPLVVRSRRVGLGYETLATRRKEQSRPIGWPPRMKARRLRRDEAGPLRELRLRALTDAPRELGCFLDEEAAFPSSYWRAIAEDTQVADRRVSVVADDGEQLVGMVGGDWDEQSGRVHLVALWVEPSSRGRGVGKALVAEVLSWARERQAHRVELWVVDDALAAAALYASCGFVETGVHQAVPYSPEQTEKLLVRLV